MWVTLKRSDPETWVASSHEMNLTAQGASLEEALAKLKQGIKHTVKDDISRGLNPRDRPVSSETLQMMDAIVKTGIRVPFKQARDALETPILTYIPMRIVGLEAHFRPAWFAWILQESIVANEL